MAVRYVNPRAQWTNGNSVVQAGAKLYFYTTGTSTPKNTYSDNDLLVANANPVVADADGLFGDIFLSPGQYKVILKTSADVTLWTADPVGDSQANVDVTGTFALSGDLTPAQITANQNNYNPSGLSGATVLRLNTDAARTITGLAGGADGRLLRVYNVGSFNITLSDESASSTAANRFALSADIVIAPDTGVDLLYDSTSSRWRALGGTSLDSLTSNGADIASASTINLTTATGDTVDVTGTTTITAITLADGDERRVRFTGALTLTNGASLVLPGAANITTAAGDIAVFRGYASSVVRCVDYQKISGLPVVSPTVVFTLSYTSSDQTITTAGALTLAHGLGVSPKIVVYDLVCQTNEAGYTAGQVLPSADFSHNMGGTIDRGLTIITDATNITVRYGALTNVFDALHATTGVATVLTNANWKVRFRAYA